MINKVLHIISNATGLTSYYIGLLQTKAYRILNQETTKALKKEGITPVDWALLGLLFEAADGMRLSDAAEELGVEAPFITERAQDLVKLKLVAITPSKADKRVKFMTLTEKARQKVPDIERALVAHIRPLIAGSSLKEIMGYKKVLERIVSNKPDK